MQTITPPVEIGQTVYVLRRPLHFRAHFTKETVRRIIIEYTENGVLCKFSSHNFEAYAEDIGKTIFLDIETAVEAVREEWET